MGTFTTRHGLYKPGVGEFYWGDLVNASLDTIDALLGSGGGDGSLLPWLNIAAEPFNADPTGATMATSAIRAAADVIEAVGGGTLYGPMGSYKVDGKLMQITDLITSFALIGDGPGLTSFVIGGDFGGDSLVGCLGRHGYGQNIRSGPHRFSAWGCYDPDDFKADLFADFWQSRDVLWEDLYIENLNGSFQTLTANLRPTIHHVTLKDCGDASSGRDSIIWQPSREGGVIAGLTEGGTIDDLKMLGSDGFAMRWDNVQRSRMGGSYLDGSGWFRSTFLIHDGDANIVTGNQVLNGSDDCIQLTSTGKSRGNVIALNVCEGAGATTPGTGFGVNEYSENAYQTHVDNVIEHNVGTVHRA